MSETDVRSLVTTAAEELPEGLRAVPYARHVYAAYKWIHQQRIKRFLIGLNAAVDDLPREERERFESYINSDVGGEVLADFAEQAVRTRSKTALAALAILYAMSESDANPDRTAQAALGLEGVSERSVDVFLLVFRSREFVDKPARGIATLSNEIVERDPALRDAGLNSDAWVATLDDLVARGLLGREFSAAGRIGGEEQWSRHFRFTADTNWYETLLRKARHYLDTRTVLGLSR